ncbi:MAG: type II secretion system protein [Phycisphaerae bacterium]|nr:type II secretion system protein [Phycisphaerae bacterium]
MKRTNRSSEADRAFTLIELLVVVSIIALLVSILLPSLSRARQQAMQVMCMTNLKQFATGIQTYVVDSDGTLPGPLHPAVYRNLDEYGPGFWSERMLTWKLRTQFKDTGGKFKASATEKVATCPLLVKVVPDSHFKNFGIMTGKGVKPTHYVINSYGRGGVWDGGLSASVVGTKPAYYFGSSYPSDNDADRQYDKPPQRIGSIKNASAEWAVAEAWFRPRDTNVSPRLQQEGPYQVAWSGEAFPNFAPHMRKGGVRAYTFVSTEQRKTDSQRIVRQMSDGATSTAFFDGHAAPVKSKVMKFANQTLFYGFPGTRNWDDGEDPNKDQAPPIPMPPM